MARARLQAPLSTQLDEPISELQVQRIWRRVQAPSEPFWSRKQLLLTAAASGVAAGVVTGMLTLRPAGPTLQRAATEPAYVTHDGTRLTAAQATQLMHEAELAERHQNVARAVALLERVRKGASGSSHAALAGWSLAQMRMASDPARAALDIQRALQDKLPDGLQEVVRARLVEAHALAGSTIAARATADLYRSSYPEGRYRADVDRWAPTP